MDKKEGSLTPEELERLANYCVMEASRTRKPGDTNADVAIEAARLALSGWRPTPKPGPKFTPNLPAPADLSDKLKAAGWPKKAEKGDA